MLAPVLGPRPEHCTLLTLLILTADEAVGMAGIVTSILGLQVGPGKLSSPDAGPASLCP